MGLAPLMTMGSLKTLPVSSKQRGVEGEKVHSSLATGCNSFSAALSLLCPCRFQIRLASPCSFRGHVCCAKPSQRVSTPSCQDGIPWKLFFLFISQKYNMVLFYWRDTDTDAISLKFCTLKSLSTFKNKSVPCQYFWFYNHLLLCSLFVLQ